MDSSADMDTSEPTKVCVKDPGAPHSLDLKRWDRKWAPRALTTSSLSLVVQVAANPLRGAQDQAAFLVAGRLILELSFALAGI